MLDANIQAWKLMASRVVRGLSECFQSCQLMKTLASSLLILSIVPSNGGLCNTSWDVYSGERSKCFSDRNEVLLSSSK